ncbi:MAG: sulfotransferase [Pseudomonadota bacterium]
MPRKDPLKVIYIAGYGRSGTTLLDIALGQQSGVFAGGEITALPRHVWNEREFCACRRQVDECGFWGSVVDAWLNPRRPDAMDLHGRRAARLEWLVDPRRLFRGLFAGNESRAYREETLALFQEIAAASGESVIVDSSKLPGRASMLMSIKEIEVFVVHMVRDGRGVAWSMMKPYRRSVEAGIQKELRPKPIWYTAARWFTVNLGAEMLRLRLPRKRSIRVRYENFVADPEGTVKSILALAGQEYVLPDHGADVMKPQHQIAGSRHRMQEEIRINKDIGWTSQMPRSLQRVFSVLTAPLLMRYGYFASTPLQAETERERDRRIGKEAV